MRYIDKKCNYELFRVSVCMAVLLDGILGDK